MAIDEQTLTALSTQTGLSREELIARITRDLPEAVNKMTPNGELPVELTQGSDETTLLDGVAPPTTQAKNPAAGQSEV
jgi:uncharacterized protein YidB (DUF937 family)